ncbi:hypothetical protein ANCDUO_11135, partial [Ancylostoma duodenale]
MELIHKQLATDKEEHKAPVLAHLALSLLAMHLIEFPVIPCTTPIYSGFNHDAVVDIHGELMQGPQ